MFSPVSETYCRMDSSVALFGEVVGRRRDEVEIGIEGDTDALDDGGDSKDEREVLRQSEREDVDRVLDLADDLVDAVLFDVLAAGVLDRDLHYSGHRRSIRVGTQRTDLDQGVQNRVDVLVCDGDVELDDLPWMNSSTRPDIPKS